MQLKRSQRKPWELVVVALAVAGAMWMSLALYAKRDQVTKERLLILELETLRNQVIAHMLAERKIPPELILSGSMVDPFGNPYHYDSDTGSVFSGTREYMNW